MHGNVLLRGGGESSAFLPLAVFLKLLKRDGVFVPLAAQAVFLNAQIVELALAVEEDFCVDQVLADFGIFLGIEISEFDPADSIDTHFE